jgi:hypothetical protein
VAGSVYEICAFIILFVILYPCGLGAQGDPSIETISDLLCITILFLIIPDLSTIALWKLPGETYSSEAEEI